MTFFQRRHTIRDIVCKPVLIALLSARALTQAQSRAASPEADLVLVNGKILTVDAKDSVAEAVAIAGGKIVADGSNEEVTTRAAKDAHVIDLHGRTATPGLIDTHCHFQEVAALYEIDLSDPSIRQVSDVVKRVQQRVASAQPGAWVRGSGWDEGKLAELRYVHAADLDKVSPNNPVWLMHTTGHYGVANSYALKLAGITRDTKDPPAGTIDRDREGNLTGVLKESAKGLVTARIPAYTREQQKSGLLKIMVDFNKEGMTAVKDPGIGPEEWSLYRELHAESKLTVRVFALFLAGTTLDSARQALSTLTGLPRPPRSFDGRLLAAAASKSSWTVAAAHAQPGCTRSGTRIRLGRTRAITAIRRLIRKCSANR